MKALVLGATGAVGSCIVEELLHDDRYKEVHTFVRRPSSIKHPKLTEHVVDFEVMYDWAKELTGDVLFSAMGISKKKAGSKDAQWHVDYDYQYNVARTAAANGVKTYALVSSVGANPDSSFFYLSMKGFLEEAVKKMEFSNVLIAQPATLIRPQPRKREAVSYKVLGLLNKVGLAKSQEPIPVEQVAKALVTDATKAALSDDKHIEILSNQYMLSF
ncbi:MAG: NAD(P)H-binding protein [Veillonella sp.]|nr:NAD(P)H-binding protein [Veillonella sp.]